MKRPTSEADRLQETADEARPADGVNRGSAAVFVLRGTPFA